MAGTISRCPSYREFQGKWLNNGRDQLLVSGLGGVRLSEVAVKETFTVFLCQIEVLDWKRCRKDRKNLSQTTKGYNKRNRTWERNITRFEFSHVCSSLQPRTKTVEAYYKIPIFCTRPDQKAYRRKMKNRSPLPYSNFVCGNTRNAHVSFKTKQLWTRIGRGGGDFVPGRNDCSMARNYETHGNV